MSNIKLFLNIFLFSIFIVLIMWACILIPYFLGCKSIERFDGLETKMSFPFFCEARQDGGEFKKIIW